MKTDANVENMLLIIRDQKILIDTAIETLQEVYDAFHEAEYIDTMAQYDALGFVEETLDYIKVW